MNEEEKRLNVVAIEIGEKRIKFLMKKLMEEGLKAMSELSSVSSDEHKILSVLVKNTNKEIEDMSL